ncbi:glycosyltransferase [Akkermansiaceae bacterium]|nr:glycosyltransferase [Akkermansiaceae bacterium]
MIAGNSGLKTDYVINTFEVKSRIPTVRGIYQIYKKVKKLDRNALLIVVSPVMIILCHFLLRKRRNVIYNFSGLGFLRSMPPIVRKIIMNYLKIYPVSGKRVFVVQNSDDYGYLSEEVGSRNNFHVELIAGSGYEDQKDSFDIPEFKEFAIGYVGRIRKDKGVLDLLRAVSELQERKCRITLNVWGELDDENRHGFNRKELDELKGYDRFLKGFSEKKNEIFRSFNWFCLPSNGEGLSKAAIEASSFGLPLVLSNVQGNRDMVNGNGFLFEYGNIDNLKEVITDILNLSAEEVDKMSIKSRRMFEANWKMKSVYGKWNRLIKKYDTTSTK